MSVSAFSSAGNSVKVAGKAIENLVLEFRSYLHPLHIRAYRDIVRRHALPPNGTVQPFACFDFNSVKIDHVSGRYVFSLVRDFEAAGFAIGYRKNFRFLATMQHKRFKRFLLDRPFLIYDSIEAMPKGSVAVEITDRAPRPGASAHRQIHVRYDPVWPRSDREFPMTFFVHPLLWDQWLTYPAPDPAAPRPWRLFFSGKKADPKYKSDTLPVKFGKMSRTQMLQTLEAGLPAGRQRRIETAADLQPAAAREPGFVWADTARYKIPPSDWLAVLGRADFFLACPGMDMPLCHNLIEALSRGAVPVLEHPEFLDPPLENGVNCLVFHGPGELAATVERIFQLKQEEIIRLREGAWAYCQKHLAPGRFARRLLDSPHARVDLLLNAYRVPRPVA